MFHRDVNPSKTNSFFLFGPRGSGKSTLVRDRFGAESLIIDLLDDQMERRYLAQPDLLLADIKPLRKKWIIIDEVQKVPKLLDLVHKAIESTKQRFILTGSSARKLRRGAANLLAGRAFLYHLFPLTARELGEHFDLLETLSWGALPKIFSYSEPTDRREFLTSYTKTYLREEILVEQVVRNVSGFRNFLEVAAQMNGKTLNFAKIARESGVDSKTVQTYYQILEDTLVGFWLPGFHKSVRKAQKIQPKFYLFDLGVQRALEGSLDSKPVPGTSLFGQYFESFVINEIYRSNEYSQKNYTLSHYQTSTGQEIDLILSKARKDILVEVKSTTKIDRKEVERFGRISKGFGSERYFVSQDSIASNIDGIKCRHWKSFIEEIFWNIV